MKKLLFITGIIALTFQFSQAQSAKITYKNELSAPKELEELKEKDPKKYERYSFMIKKMNERTKQLRYTLKFNDQRSEFKTNPKMAKGDDAVSNMSMPQSEYFYDLSNNKRYQKNNISGKEFLINKESIAWEILPETKVINGYKARKAVASQTFFSVDRESGELKEKEQPVTAWFTTELPFAYGPENYGGLPGLILELKTQGKNYSVEKLGIDEDKDLEIKFPDLSNALSEKEAASMMHKAAAKMFGR